MSWNHRVIRRVRNPNGNEEETFHALHEVYYDEQDRIKGWTKDAMAPIGETVEELRAELRMFTAALDKPVLEEAKGEGPGAPEQLREVAPKKEVRAEAGAGDIAK